MNEITYLKYKPNNKSVMQDYSKNIEVIDTGFPRGFALFKTKLLGFLFLRGVFKMFKDCVESGLIIIDGERYPYWILESPIGKELAKNPKLLEYLSVGYNGYVGIPRKLIRQDGYRGIVEEAQVHGGVTFAGETPRDNFKIYGFDTGHYNSSNFTIHDKQWMREQCVILLKGLLESSKNEKYWIRASRKAWLKSWREDNRAVLDSIRNKIYVKSTEEFTLKEEGITNV